MKKILGIVFLMLFLVSATEIASPVPQNPKTLEGTWELESFNNYDGNDVVQTIPPSDGYRQIKMYYNGKVMWTRYVPTDSIEWFGYGSYKATDSTLTEKLEYMSASMKKVANENMEWHMELQLEGDRYRQIFIDEDGNRINSENYKRLN